MNKSVVNQNVQDVGIKSNTNRKKEKTFPKSCHTFMRLLRQGPVICCDAGQKYATQAIYLTEVMFYTMWKMTEKHINLQSISTFLLRIQARF